MNIEYFPALLTIILTLFLLMICGFISRKLGFIDATSSKGLSRLILSVGQPMMLVSSLSAAEYSAENVTLAWQVTLIGFVSHAIMALMGFVICRLFKKDDKMKIFEFSLVFANCGFIGFPIMDAILGAPIGSFMGAFYNIGFYTFLWTYGLMILGRGRDDIRLTPKKIFLNFGTVPCLIGVILFLCKPLFVLPEFATKCFTYLGNLCTPISVLVTGALLATISLPQMFKSGKLYLHSAIKLIAFPVIMCLLAKLCGLSGNYILLITAMAGMPSAATITMLAEVHNIEPGYASQTVGFSSILSVATLPLVMVFAQWIIGL